MMTQSQLLLKDFVHAIQQEKKILSKKLRNKKLPPSFCLTFALVLHLVLLPSL
jgi:hypothetical protein